MKSWDLQMPVRCAKIRWMHMLTLLQFKGRMSESEDECGGIIMTRIVARTTENGWCPNHVGGDGPRCVAGYCTQEDVGGKPVGCVCNQCGRLYGREHLERCRAYKPEHAKAESSAPKANHGTK